MQKSIFLCAGVEVHTSTPSRQVLGFLITTRFCGRVDTAHCVIGAVLISRHGNEKLNETPEHLNTHFHAEAHTLRHTF